MQPLVVREGLVIPAEQLSVSFTRTLDAEDAATSARKTPSSVELRFDTRHSPGLGPMQLQKILRFKPLRADRRGTVRVVCDEFSSRTKNLEGARLLLRQRINEALDAPLEEDAETPKRKRGRAGLIKAQ